MRFSFFVVLFVCAAVHLLSAQQTTLLLRLHQIPTSGVMRQHPIEVVLARYYQDNFSLVTAQKINNDTVQHFSFSIPSNSPTALYQIFIGDTREQSINKAEFIWSAKENLVMDAVFFQLKDGSVSIEKSNENEAYAQLNQLKEKFDPILDELYQKRFNLVVFDAQYKQKALQLEMETERAQLVFDNALAQLAELFPGTYTADVLVPLTLIPVRSAREVWANQYDSYLSFLNSYYFYHTDFNNGAVLYHYAFHEKLFKYLNEYIEHSTTGSEKGIDVIMGKLQEHTEVNSFVFNLLLKSFIKAGSEYLTKYLMDKHSSECALNLPFEELKKLQSMQSLAIGGTAPEISLPDDKGNYQSLRAYCQKNKYTIVFFWISWCARCQKESPKLVELFKKYQSKGLGVYAVSLDEKKEDWLAAIQKYGSTWINAAELVPVPKSRVLPDYQVSTTPAIFILNSKGEVVNKNLFGVSLEQFLAEKFQ